MYSNLTCKHLENYNTIKSNISRFEDLRSINHLILKCG